MKDFFTQLGGLFETLLVAYVGGTLIGLPAFLYGFEFMNPLITGAIASSIVLYTSTRSN